ncbi:MAG: tRNA lysidine(34) synthetase TilS [Ruminococcaceae bacterium]|nr:tRNA lysidine(34) synthetase TilS [Oscillospiraceae bacterium]
MIDKESLLLACDSLFNSELGKKTYLTVKKTILDNNMQPLLMKGVAVGFSGGPDSVLLLIILRKLQKELDFNLKALHVNHMIRGKNADRDEIFSKVFAEALSIDFEALRVDVPKYAKDNHLGIEEAARQVRYDFFDKALDSDENLGAIATAHNSTDNLETLLFNLMRGSGTHGLGGIAPIRDNVIRPLIAISKEDVLRLLADAKIPFVTDETNFSVEYMRNYIRHEIIPKFKHLTPCPENMATKATSILRSDSEYIDSVADRFCRENENQGKIHASLLRTLHHSVLSRVIRLMCKKQGLPTPEKIHIDKIQELLETSESFEVDIPGEAAFFLKESFCFIGNKKGNDSAIEFEHTLYDGFNEIPELNIGIAITNDESEDFSSNVYKISMKAKLSSAIIYGSLSVRTKKDGDSYYYGGITRKLKKLFCDKKIPISVRLKTPVITDEKGILWVPGFGVRDDSPKEKNNKWITIYQKIN